MTSKIKTSLITASFIAAASSFTGCGSSSSTPVDPAPTSVTINAPQDGEVVMVPAGGLQLTYTVTPRTCTSINDLNISSGKYTFGPTNFTCDSGTMSTTEAYKLKVLPGAIIDTDGDGVYSSADTKTLDIEIKAKSTDAYPSVLTTLREVATEQNNTALADSLANVGAESPIALLASKPQLYATSQMVVKAIKAAAASGKTVSEAAKEIASASTGITAINLSSTTAPTITTNTSASASVQAFANTNAIQALTGIVKATATTTGVTAAQVQATLVKEVEAKNVSLVTLGDNLGIALTTITGDTVDLALIVSEEVYQAIGDADEAISQATDTLNNYDNAPKLTVNSIGLKVGSNNYLGTANDFNITKTSTQTVSANDDVVITVSASQDNDFNVTDGTLMAEVTNGAKTLTLVINKVTINKNTTTEKLQATIASGATVSIVSNYSGIASRSAVTSSAVTTTDLSFSLNTLIAAINQGDMATAKTEIITTLTKAGTYTLTVGVSGIDISAVTNLTDVSSKLTTGYKGFTGTVNVQAQ